METQLLGETAHTPPHTHLMGFRAADISTVSEGEQLPGAKRIGGLKTSDCEGYVAPWWGLQKKRKDWAYGEGKNETEPELGLRRGLSPKVSYGMSSRELAEWELISRQGLCPDSFAEKSYRPFQPVLPEDSHLAFISLEFINGCRGGVSHSVLRDAVTG